MKKLLLLPIIMLLATIGAYAQSSNDEPIITIKTHRYATHGAENNIQFSLGASVKCGTTTVKIDFGFGPKEYEITSDISVGEGEEDSEEEDVVTDDATISGSVSEAGIIRIYGNAEDIDYLNVHGSEVYDIDISKMTNLSILELGHNEIEKLDLSMMQKLEYLDVKDNAFSKGLILGEHPFIKYINVNQMGDHALDHCNGVIDLTKYKALNIFTAWDSHCLKSIDPSQCLNLRQLSVDNTGIKSIDVSNNTFLQILNVSDCGINSIDISNNPYLVELYIANEGWEGSENKLSTLDLSNNTELQRLFCSGNNLTTLDVSKQWNLITLQAAHNRLTSIKGVDINEPADQRPQELAELDISSNCFTFATLPEVDPMTYYYYDFQAPLPVEKEYSAGMTAQLDLSKYVLREGSTTQIAAASISRDGFSDAQLLVEGEDYSYDIENGIVTFYTPQADSVQVACYNNMFEGVILTTSQFLVRSEEEYGTPVELFNVTPAVHGAMTLTLTTKEDETLYIDNGDGNKVPYKTTAMTPKSISVNAQGCVRFNGRVATSVEAIRIENVMLTDIDVNKQTNLKEITINNCDLSSIDLSWNHALRTIDLSNNKLTSLDLNGDNNAFHKNLLRDVNVSHNELSSLDLGISSVTIKTVNASANKLETLDLSGMERLQTLNLSGNIITELDLSSCTALENLNLSSNSLKALDLSTCGSLVQSDLTNNNFTFATMPTPVGNATLAPQKDLKIASRAMTINLSAQASVNGTPTIYTWKEAETGDVLTQGTDYTLNNGKTTFAEHVIGKALYCEMTNALFPEFTGDKALRTTTTIATGMPQHVIASFDTPVGGQTALLSLAAYNPDTYIYIDWGDDDLREYQLQTMYTRFTEDKTIEGAKVKVYSNVAADGDMYVFSVDSITMTNIDVSKMTNLYCLSLCNAGLSSLDLSGNTSLGELNLEGNHFTTIDLTAHRNLNMLTLSKNELTEIKLAENNHIAWFAAAYNNISTFDEKMLRDAYNVDLAGNHLTTFNAKEIPGLGQLFIAQNNLHEIDLESNPAIMVLDISGNKFDMSTLPYPSYNVYFYGNQQPLEIECIDQKIDLSSQTTAWGKNSDIFFFDGPISIVEDEEGNLYLENYEFTAGTDFYNESGIITFEKSHPAVTGLVVNELYPSLLLYTKTIKVTGITDAITDVNAGSDEHGFTYNIAGQRVNDSAKGILIKNGKAFVRK